MSRNVSEVYTYFCICAVVLRASLGEFFSCKYNDIRAADRTFAY